MTYLEVDTLSAYISLTCGMVVALNIASWMMILEKIKNTNSMLDMAVRYED